MCKPVQSHIVTFSVLGFLMGVVGVAHALPIPGSWDFGTDPGKVLPADAGFAQNIGGGSGNMSWVQGPDSTNINNTSGGSGGTGYKSAHTVGEFPGLSSLSTFTVRTEMEIQLTTGSLRLFRAGVALLGDGVGTANGVNDNGNTGYAFVLHYGGGAANTINLRMEANGIQGPTLNMDLPLIYFTQEQVGNILTEYVPVILSVKATRVGTEDWLLEATAEFPQTGESETIVYNSATHPTPAGQWQHNDDFVIFGARKNVNHPQNLRFVNFEIIPEPASLALLGLGGLLLVSRRQR